MGSCQLPEVKPRDVSGASAKGLARPVYNQTGEGEEMPEVMFANYHNGEVVHYIDSLNDPCHAAIVAGNWTQDETSGAILSADIIQQDAVSLGAVVPLRRNDTAFDAAADTADTFHYGGCNRGM